MAGTLLIEGYLTKLQHTLGSLSRSRWFQVTTTRFGYYDKEGGKLIASCALSDIVKVVPTGNVTFKVKAKRPFTKSGASTVGLQCQSEPERDKWLSSIQQAIPDAVTTTLFTPLPQRTRGNDDHFGVGPGQKYSCFSFAHQREYSKGCRLLLAKSIARARRGICGSR